MSVEVKTHKLGKEDKAVQAIASKILPGVNRILSAPPFIGLDQSKLITKIVVEESWSNFRNKLKAEKPIGEIYPYHDELVGLGVKREVIEEIVDDGRAPYQRDLFHNPNQLNVPKNFPILYENPIARISTIILLLDIQGAPQPKQVMNPEVKSVAREIVRKHALETSLKQMITKSGLDYENPKFDHVKTRINQDLDEEQTQFFFLGAYILGVLDGQTVGKCAFGTDADLHQGIASLLAEPMAAANLVNLGINPIYANGIMQELRAPKQETITRLASLGLDFAPNESLTETERIAEKLDNQRLLSSLYLNSQIPLLIAMGNGF